MGYLKGQNMLRRMHFVGSVPSDSAEQAMRSMLEWSGAHVRSISDGETGARKDWIANILDGFREHPDLSLRRAGDFSSFKDIPLFRVRPGHRLGPENFDFGHDTEALAVLPVFRALRDEYVHDDLRLQVGIPGDLDLALFAFGPLGGFRHRAIFREVLAREIQRVHAVGGDDIVFQLELPAELVFTTKAPGLLGSAMAGLLAGGVIRLVQKAPVNARFGIHLCVGDLNHDYLGRLRNARPLVTLANALVRRWPADRPLEYVHVPFTGGIEKVPGHAGFYAPLSDLHLPKGTRLIAGLVQETCSTADLRRVMALAEEAYGHPVDVAATCGLGRRTADQAETNSLMARELCEEPEPPVTAGA